VVLGYLLDAVGRNRQEAARLSYLKHPAPARALEAAVLGTDENRSAV